MLSKVYSSFAPVLLIYLFRIICYHETTVLFLLNINRLIFSSLLKDVYQLVRDCVCGQVFDSTPVDFTSDLGTRFVLHPSVLKMSQPPRVVSWVAKAFASGLDTLFLNRFEEQRSEYWQTLYSSVVRTLQY